MPAFVMSFDNEFSSESEFFMGIDKGNLNDESEDIEEILCPTGMINEFTDIDKGVNIGVGAICIELDIVKFLANSRTVEGIANGALWLKILKIKILFPGLK